MRCVGLRSSAQPTDAFISYEIKGTGMSDTEQQFWDLVEELIGNANEKSAHQDPALTSDAMLYAAARFGAYAAAIATAERKEFKEELGDIKALLMQQFETMLDANLDDYLENYKIYLER